MPPTRYPDSRPNPHWRQPDYARDGEAIWAAYHKRQRKLVKLTSTPEALTRRAEMEAAFDQGSPLCVPPLNTDYDT